MNAIISAHAIDRFIERTGTTKGRESVRAKLEFRLSNAHKLRKNYWYNSGFIFCVRNGICVTIMKPTVKRTQLMIHSAMKAIRA